VREPLVNWKAPVTLAPPTYVAVKLVSMFVPLLPARWPADVVSPSAPCESFVEVDDAFVTVTFVLSVVELRV
jgi:hypothetical protein